jgi:cystathionine beta-lyase
MTPSLNPNLTELPLERLRLRRSVKWAMHPVDVLPSFVAEMDFPLAEPVRVALAEAVELDDTGYAWPEAIGLGEAFAEFARRRLGWSVDPAQVSPSSDVVGAITAVLGEIAEPGDKVVINPPVYHPFFGLIEELGCEVAEALLVDGRFDVEAIERQFADGAVALISAAPTTRPGRRRTASSWWRSQMPPSATAPGCSRTRSMRR